MRPYKRSFKNYLIDKQFQTKYLLLTILLLSTYTLIFLIILFLPSIMTIISETTPEEKAAASRTFLVLHNTVWPTTALAITIYGIFSLLITHKIAGPVYRLKYALSELIKGNLDTRIHLRRWDDLQELASQVNLFSEELNSHINTLKREHDQLSTSISQLEEEIKTENGRAIIRQLQEQKNTMGMVLEHFKEKS